MQVTRGVLRSANSSRNAASYDVPSYSFAGSPRQRRFEGEIVEIEGQVRKVNRRNSSELASKRNSCVARDIPEPSGLPFFGTLISLLASGGAKHLHEYVNKRHKELGPVYRERIGPVKAVFVNSPDEYRRIFRLEGSTPRHFLPEAWLLYNQIRNCRRGLFFMDGYEWLRFRRILNKVMLLPGSTNLMLDPSQRAAEELVEKWLKQLENDARIKDLEAQLYRWSIDVMLSTLMGSSWQIHKEKISKDTEKLASMLHKIFVYSADLSMVPAKLAMNLRLSFWNNFVACVDTALEIVRNLVPEMARLGGDGLLKKMTNEGIRGDDAICIVTDFILAAGDTTATSMQWILFLLCNHPQWQGRLCDRLHRVSREEISREPLLKGLIKEAHRLYPVAPFISRYLSEDSVIGNYFVPKGELLLLSVYSSSRDAANFPQPNQFLPERWIREEEGTYRGVLHPHASIPFALGARSCIGRKLAEIQMSLALAKIVETFKIECTNKKSVKMILHLISVPSEPIQLTLTRR